MNLRLATSACGQKLSSIETEAEEQATLEWQKLCWVLSFDPLCETNKTSHYVENFVTR